MLHKIDHKASPWHGEGNSLFKCTCGEWHSISHFAIALGSVKEPTYFRRQLDTSTMVSRGNGWYSSPYGYDGGPWHDPHMVVWPTTGRADLPPIMELIIDRSID